MRRLSNRSALDDPSVWADVTNFIPTSRGTYIGVADYGGTTLTATGEVSSGNKIVTAKSFELVDGSVRTWVISESLSWSFNGTLTDFTNALGGITQVCQYGNISIGVRNSTTPKSTVYSSGGNWAALGGGSPSADICCTAANAVLLFSYHDGGSQYTDGWWASDIGDYTAWTPAVSNQAANGRFLDTPGPVTAAIQFRNGVLAFKRNAIYLGTYVGRPAIWTWELISKNLGCVGKYAVCECGDQIAFVSHSETFNSGTTNDIKIYLYDGSRFSVLNPDVYAYPGTDAKNVVLGYDKTYQRLYLSGQQVDFGAGGTSDGSDVFVCCLQNGLWGKYTKPVSGTVVIGDGIPLTNAFSYGSNGADMIPIFAIPSTDNKIMLYQFSGSQTKTCSVTTSKVGTDTSKSVFDRVIPRYRYYSDFGFGSPGATLEMVLYSDLIGTANTTRSGLTPSTTRTRFDLRGGVSSDNYATFKLTLTDVNVEIEDLNVISKESGRE